MNKMPAESECALILRAQAGDEPAKLELLAMYTPLANTTIRAWSRLIPSADDARACCTIGILAAIQAFDPSRCLRLAGMARNHMQDRLWEHASSSIGATTIPRTVLARYFRVMSDPRVAGDPIRAREVCPEYAISARTVHSVWASLNQREMTAESADPQDRTACVEDRILAGIALDAMSSADRRVVSMRCGFDGHREMSVEEVADALLLSPLLVRRSYAAGLAAGRLALAA